VDVVAAPADEQRGPRLELTWFVHAEGPMDPQTGLSSRRVELEVRASSTIQRIALGEQFGALSASNQTACKTSSYPNEGDDVAKLTFYYGGAGGFSVKRASQSTLGAFAWSQPDGLCMNAQGQPDACPGSQRRIALIQVQSDDPIEETIIELDPRAREQRLVCTGE
jgi:hypothetical protein